MTIETGEWLTLGIAGPAVALNELVMAAALASMICGRVALRPPREARAEEAR